MTKQVLGNRYELEDLLGQGGMAQVYRARDRVLGRPVAIKILRAEYTGDATLVARFQREARAAANLVHPNIVAIYDVGQEGSLYYIVMEFVSGPTLKEIIRQRAPLPVDFALRVAEQVCSALEYAHRHEVIHRDVKPQNILLSEDEEIVKVADFGIAKSRLDPDSTADRLALGTVKYISPEQARGADVLPQSDIYSLGVVLYEMLTGQQPFDGETPISIAVQQIETPPLPPRQINPYLPIPVESIVLRAMSKDPHDRFPSARDMRMALERYRLAGVEMTGPIPSPVVVGSSTTVPPVRAARSAAGGGVEPPLVRQARPGPATPVESAHQPYGVPRRQAQRREGGIGAVGIVMLVLILIGIASLGIMWPKIFGQGGNPTPGATNTPPATVEPTSPSQVPVPDLTGMTVDEAKARLQQYGLVYVEGQPRYDPYQKEPGRIVAQEPSYGVYATWGSTVTVSLGAKPGLARIPDVIQMSYEGARLKLEGEGFRVERLDVGCVNTPTGAVDRQDPPGNREDAQGITVTVYVSIGSQSVVPDLLRVPFDEAKRRIESAGLILRYAQGQTQADMPPGVRIGDLADPGQVISYVIYYDNQGHTSGQLHPGDLVPCRAYIDLAYYLLTP